MKLTTNAQRILNELFQQDFADNGSYADESQYFEVFSSKQILKSNDLSDEEIENGVLGSGNDGGCDSIYTLFNGAYVTEDIVSSITSSKEAAIELVITQAKTRNFIWRRCYYEVEDNCWELDGNRRR